ncbi:MAG: hypothetical protein WAV00_05930 [Nocardioides sp.]
MTDSPPRTRPQLRRDYAAELRWTFSHRRSWLLGFVLNLCLAAAFVGYTHYSPRTGGLRLAGVAAELAAWVIASTLATNQLGDDYAYVLSRIEQHDSVVRVLLSKNLVLASLLVPIRVAVSVAAQLDITRPHQLFPSVTEDLLDLFVVLLWLGIGGLTSVVLPSRPLPPPARWRARNTWPRWLARQAMPYLLFFSVIPLLTLPPYEMARHLFGGRHTNLTEYSATFVLWGLVVWTTGLALAAWYVRRAPDRLQADLRRPS